jgi:hypothetical protein
MTISPLTAALESLERYEHRHYWDEHYRYMFDYGSDYLNGWYNGHWYARYGDQGKRQNTERTIEILLSRGADPHRKSGRFGNVLLGAVQLNNKTIVHHILKASPDALTRKENQGILAVAVCFSGSSMVKCLLEMGASINLPGGEVERVIYSFRDPNHSGHYEKRYLEIPIVEAALKGDLDVLRILVAHGADVNAPGITYGNALCAAAHERHVELVEFLLGCNADINKQGGEFAENPLLPFTGGGSYYNFNITLGSPFMLGQWRAGRIVILLLEKETDVKVRKEKYQSALAVGQAKGLDLFIERLTKYDPSTGEEL